MSAVDTLDVYQNDRLIGKLFDQQPLRFRYDASWTSAPAATPLSDQLPLSVEDHQGEHVHAYFENLLPEGNIRRFISASRHATTVFGLLRSIGGDTAGGLTLMPEGEKPLPPSYAATSWARLKAQLRSRPVPAFVAEIEGARISLAGAQDKVLLMLRADGTPAIPRGTAPSSHILKPDIGGLDGVWASALNETFVMRLAAVVGLGVADASFQPDTRACLIRRYDRIDDGHGALMPLASCRQLLRHSVNEAADLRRFLQWIFFNLYVGNNDSHAKNLSILVDSNGATRLAPFYDLMCTAMYPGLSRKFAFAIGGEMTPGRIEARHLSAMAKELNVGERYLMQMAADVAARLPLALDQVSTELGNQALAGTETTLLERLTRWISRNTRKLSQRWLG